MNLTKHFDQFIESGLASGRFGNASKMMREGLRLLEQREMEDRAKLEWLRAAVQEGIDDLERGDYVTLHSPRQEIGDWMSQVREEATGTPALKQKRG